MNFNKNILKESRNFDFRKLKSKNFYKENQESFIKTVLGVFFVLFFLFQIFLKPPSDFPTQYILHIEEGLNLNEIVVSLKQENIIKYSSTFKFLAYISFNQRGLNEGDYFFDKDINSFSVLIRLARGDYGITPKDITFPEGATVSEIGEILKSEFPDFDEKTFLRLTKNKEGFLFPDTYKFLPNVGPRKVIAILEANFNKKIEEFLPAIEESGYSVNEIITFASLLEEEARTLETRRMISSVLWNRIEIDMALQVDAVFPYIIGKNTFELTLEDLQIDSPYNTYQNIGLPPGPISNPGLDSIRAALDPIPNDYFYYLSDRNGNTHYAKTFSGHKRNRVIYLN